MMTTTAGAAQSQITLKGSTDVVTEFFGVCRETMPPLMPSSLFLSAVELTLLLLSSPFAPADTQATQ
jgi:hypothetical protein